MQQKGPYQNNNNCHGNENAKNAQSNEWSKCCNVCIQGKATLLTNCGHLTCIRCLDPSASIKQCPICQRNCSIMQLKHDLTDLPEEIKILFQPVDQLILNQKKKIQQVLDFQRSQQSRLITNLKTKMKKMSEKWNAFLKKAKSQEEDIKNLRIQNENLQHTISRNESNYLPNKAPQYMYSSSNSTHDQNYISQKNYTSSSSQPNNSSSNNEYFNQFLMNFTPLKNDYESGRNSHPINNYNSQQQSPYHNNKAHTSPVNSVNPNQRMSVRTPLSQQKLNNSLTRTPSPYQMNKSLNQSRTPSPHFQSLNTSFSSIQSSTPNVSSINTIKSSISHNQKQNERVVDSNINLHPNNEELKQKANSALMRLSQSLAAKSLLKK